MRAVVQRVLTARVTVEGRDVGAIGRGLLVFIGVETGDGATDVEYIATKVREIRVFEDERDASGRKRMNHSVEDVGGAVLVVSQFTLAADVRRGRRPSFDQAAPPAQARPLYEDVVEKLRAAGLTVETGEFQAMMRVSLENDGPVTILMDSRKRW
ncbi:MAG: D-tyrosyl-tRNA(Tyr) deacylase [Acidobacteria bacterium]|nr:D-tyrosyl-tRNA(Tyr) deacylase [Acidobacteriota bacterium]